MPEATGRARPCRPSNPYFLTKCGILLPQPMPEVIATCSVGRFSSAIAIFSVLRIKKSPQPGHQVGASLVVNCAIVAIAFLARELPRAAERGGLSYALPPFLLMVAAIAASAGVGALFR